MSPVTAIGWCVLWPLLGALAVGVCGERRRNLREACSLLTAISLFAVVAGVLVGGGGTPLHSAAQMGNLEAVESLLNAGVDIHRRDNTGNTALIVAAVCPTAARPASPCDCTSTTRSPRRTAAFP